MPGGFLEDDDIKQMVRNLVALDAVSINEELSGLLDYSRADVKKFIKEFVQRVDTQRNIQIETKRVQ